MSSPKRLVASPDFGLALGATAQDFHAAFGFGEDDKHMSIVNAEGVALSAIQALYQTVTITELRARLARMGQR